MLELLSPAGSPEAAVAAVQNGADAIYLGCGDFNARRNAANFSQEQLAEAVRDCHLRGVKVYLTLNTLLSDRELPQAADLAVLASGLGVDAVLVQDLGVLRMVRQVAPDLPVHASTQMTIHSLDGAMAAAELGMTRVVLSRELSRDQIAHICQNAPIEVEVFVHGALCMCYSGQCFFSSVIGGRSGNRGMCAQPCRLNYGWDGQADRPLLSLKDMSLAGHLRELDEMGVACVKIEGRMKRPEYVAVVTRIYAAAIREGREPTPEELRQLEAAFSRQGFTDGYFTGRTGKAMFGVREEGPDPTELFARARAEYLKGEGRRVPVKLYAMLRPGEPVRVGAEDDRGNVATAEGSPPEAARNRAVTAGEVEERLAKTGGTPFVCAGARALVEPGLSVSAASLTALRRQVLDELAELRTRPPRRRQGEFSFGARYANRKEPPVYTVSVRRADQITRELLALEPAVVYFPPELAREAPEKVELIRAAGAEPAVTLPRIQWDRDVPGVEELLLRLRQLGVQTALAGNLAGLVQAARLGFRARGDYGLGVCNTLALKELRHMGLQSATVSFEQRLARIRDISKPLDIEMIVYGRLPLMITENCIIHDRFGVCSCQNVNQLTDRKGARFPVVQACGHRNEILNSKKLFLADRQEDYQHIGLWAARLMFTTENARECVQVMERYRNRGSYAPGEWTRGLYYREVE